MNWPPHWNRLQPLASIFMTIKSNSCSMQMISSPTEKGLQQSLDLLEQHCQTQALTVNTNETTVMIFQKKTRSQANKFQFTLQNSIIEHTTNYPYLGLIISTSGKFYLAVNAFYTIKEILYNLNPPIKIWIKIFDSVIKPIALYGSEVWGPITNYPNYTKWEKNPCMWNFAKTY